MSPLVAEGWASASKARGAVSMLTQEFFLVGEHGSVLCGYAFVWGLPGPLVGLGLVVVGDPFGMG